MTDYSCEIERLKESRCYSDNVIKLQEECGELTQAVAKEYFRGTPETRQHVIEEMVDVKICMDILCKELHITDAELADMRHHKMLRNLMRIEGGLDG